MARATADPRHLAVPLTRLQVRGGEGVPQPVSSPRRTRKYYKEVSFAEPVNPDTAKAQYRNGVLTITIEKKEKTKKEKGVKIKVE